ncbi:Zinc finger, CCHC-type [Metarhizium album ARSEF 1941]|uniref:Zinc finger, CCHC-type n=1 Tax=Metarhizium album (strain ARSEF 1941) TaxID=1081103 RepID=A0A0B2WGK6_METAS|nr:Zinc finger, CCHC-type [Metarhizium album ARSEF 1941]KHN95136.1 Zinc finger, CCHC-type [Metarhizium album ARSEF 1941]
MAAETPKGISSRLLTMKFMQRAVASASSNGSPNSGLPSSKKRKLDHSPAPGRIDPNIDQALIQAALDDQEATRQAALARHSSADTRWVLKSKIDEPQGEKLSHSLNIVYVGYGDIDASNDSHETEDNPAEGRTYQKRPKTEQSAHGDNSDESGDKSDGTSDDESDSTGRNRITRSSDGNRNMKSPRSRSQSRSRHSHEASKAKEFRDKRKRKEVRLNRLTAISSAGDGQFSSHASPNTKAMKCYNCQRLGHRASECSKRNAPG